jgi:hypothetical protein
MRSGGSMMRPLPRRANVRILTLCAMLTLVAPVPATGASLSATAQSGVKTKVSSHAAFGSSCVPQHVIVKVTTPPANGSVTTAEESAVMPARTKLGGAQRCAGRSAPTAVLYYQSKPRFKGQDQFKYQRINQNDPNDRLNGEVLLTVTVK